MASFIELTLLAWQYQTGRQFQSRENVSHQRVLFGHDPGFARYRRIPECDGGKHHQDRTPENEETTSPLHSQESFSGSMQVCPVRIGTDKRIGDGIPDSSGNEYNTNQSDGDIDSSSTPIGRRIEIGAPLVENFTAQLNTDI